jgi:hypothetical protein
VLKGLKPPPPAFVYARSTCFLIWRSKVGGGCCRVSSRDEESGYCERRDLFLTEAREVDEDCTRYFEVAELMKVVGIE